MTYGNFNASVYCPVQNLLSITNFEDFDKKFQLIENNVKVGKVYLETYRSGVTIEKDMLIKVKEYFENKGILTSGGITTDDSDNGDGGFSPFCYSSEKTKQKLIEVVSLTAEVFDEFILDDFYFTNCRCDCCIEAKKERTWAQFRLQLMKNISENIIIKTAKEVNPNCKTIIKFPNWYEHYQDAGYNLEDEPMIFDYIYTGTETRNPTYTQQHLPKYLSYFIMRYLENVAPNRNLGGWFDPYECTYNLTSYADQGYLTLFGKAKEAMLFSLGSLMNDPSFTLFPPVIGQVFEDVDRYINQLGAPTGVACYLPYHSHGEDFLHNYIGMLGIPLEPFPSFPADAKNIFLTQSAAYDTSIITKIKKSLNNGSDVIVTSGFVEKMKEEFYELAHIEYSPRKAMVNKYAYSPNGGVSYGGCEEASKSILIPHLEFFTNDVWELIGGLLEDNNFPILLKTKYSKGRLFILTIPEDFGDLYHYPRTILNTIREAFHRDAKIKLDAVSKITLFTYDNDTFIVKSFNEFYDEVSVIVMEENVALLDLERDYEITGISHNGKTTFSFTSAPGTNNIFKIVHKK